jgi:hypothetical protein
VDDVTRLALTARNGDQVAPSAPARQTCGELSRLVTIV